MNGKRSIYVALTSLASPNEELNVLSTAAEQEKNIATVSEVQNQFINQW